MIEFGDASGLGSAGASSEVSGLRHFGHVLAARQGPACRLPGQSGVIAFSPPTPQRNGDTTVEVPPGLTAPDGACVRIDVRAAGDDLVVCVSDTPGGWLSFVATCTCAVASSPRRR